MRSTSTVVASFFDGLAREHGLSHRALAYGSQETQRRKFEALVDVGIGSAAEEVSVLDVGSGFGDLAAFMTEKGIRFRYAGIDIAGEIVSLARAERPHLDIRQEDILTMPGEAVYDYVVSTGFNCVRTGRNWSTLTRALAVMFRLARVGVAVSSVSTYRTEKNPNTYYASPERVFAWCMKHLTTRVTVRHDYLPHDFTMYLYK